MTNEERQEIVDGEHLRALSICYVVSGAVHLVFSVFSLFYIFMGVAFATILSDMPGHTGQPPPPAFMGLFFGLFGFVMFVYMVGLGVLQLVVARRLKQRRSRVLCMVVAGVTCLGIPYGTALGVFTFLVLARPSIVGAFGSGATAPVATPAG